MTTKEFPADPVTGLGGLIKPEELRGSVRPGPDPTGRRKIIIDTDPGQDDAVAILAALGAPELEVLGLTIVAGNVPLPLTVRAARQVVELADRTDVPIYAGAARPIRRPLVTAEHVHGDTGLDGPDLPDPTVAVQDEHAVDFIVRTVRESEPGEITIVLLGPATNLALAFSKAPDIIPKIREVVAVAGTLHEGGNITPLGDFNSYVDPDATQVIIHSGVPTVFIPADVTHAMRTTEERLERILATGGRCSKAVVEMLRFSQVFDIAKYGWEAGPLHDPSAIVYLLAPELFTGRRINVEVVTSGTVSVGMSVIDWWGVSGRTPNVDYYRDIEVQPAFDLLTERLATLP